MSSSFRFSPWPSGNIALDHLIMQSWFTVLTVISLLGLICVYWTTLTRFIRWNFDATVGCYLFCLSKLVWYEYVCGVHQLGQLGLPVYTYMNPAVLLGFIVLLSMELMSLHLIGVLKVHMTRKSVLATMNITGLCLSIWLVIAKMYYIDYSDVLNSTSSYSTIDDNAGVSSSSSNHEGILAWFNFSTYLIATLSLNGLSLSLFNLNLLSILMKSAVILTLFSATYSLVLTIKLTAGCIALSYAFVETSCSWAWGIVSNSLSFMWSMIILTAPVMRLIVRNAFLSSMTSIGTTAVAYSFKRSIWSIYRQSTEEVLHLINSSIERLTITTIEPTLASIHSFRGIAEAYAQLALDHWYIAKDGILQWGTYECDMTNSWLTTQSTYFVCFIIVNTIIVLLIINFNSTTSYDVYSSRFDSSSNNAFYASSGVRRSISFDSILNSDLKPKHERIQYLKSFPPAAQQYIDNECSICMESMIAESICTACITEESTAAPPLKDTIHLPCGKPLQIQYLVCYSIDLSSWSFLYVYAFFCRAYVP